VLRWWFSDYRNQGTIVGGSSMLRINSPAWTPDLFYPDESHDCCTGVLTVTTTGTISDLGQDSTMSSKANVVYPLIARTKNVTIHHP
jgi:hypothetical protein